MRVLRDTSSVICIMGNRHTNRSCHHPTLDRVGPITLIRLGTLDQFFYKHQGDQASFRLTHISFVSYLYIIIK